MVSHKKLPDSTIIFYRSDFRPKSLYGLTHSEETELETELLADSSFLGPDFKRAVDGVNYVANHLKTEDDKNNVSDFVDRETLQILF